MEAINLWLSARLTLVKLLTHSSNHPASFVCIVYFVVLVLVFVLSNLSAKKWDAQLGASAILLACSF